MNADLVKAGFWIAFYWAFSLLYALWLVWGRVFSIRGGLVRIGDGWGRFVKVRTRWMARRARRLLRRFASRNDKGGLHV